MRRLMVLGMTAATLALAVGVGSAAAETAPLPPLYPSYEPFIEQDAGVVTSAAPSTATVGNFALLSSIVTNHGESTAVTTFTDTVPNGLAITSVAAGSGACTIVVQTIVCRLLIPPADLAPVNIVVTPTAAGSYSNKVSIAPTGGQRDPNPANDGASATLTVAPASAPAPAPTCTVPALRRTPLRVAKRVLTVLDCKPGKAKWVHSRGVARGQVIRSAPKPGTYNQGKAVALTVSSGPAKAKRRGR